MERIPASERTREKLKAVIEGTEKGAGASELVRLAARLIIEEALESAAREAVGRAVRALGARHIAIVSPYSDEVNQRAGRYFASKHGLEAVALEDLPNSAWPGPSSLDSSLEETRFEPLVPVKM